MIIVVMGVAGAGKTTVGERLARSLGFQFLEADDFHSKEAIAKMRAGVALDDADRAPWLRRLAEKLGEIDRRCGSAVLACSALKEAYRRELRATVTRGKFVLVYLKISGEVAMERLKDRPEHYMPASLVASQFEALEEPKDAIEVDGSGEPTESVEEIVTRIRPKKIGA
jgi:gluconokinase